MKYAVRGNDGCMISEREFDTYQEAGVYSLKLKKEGWHDVVIRKKEDNGQILKSIDSLWKVQMHNAIHRH